MASFREVRDLLLDSFDDGELSEDEFLLLYDLNTSKNPDFPYECCGEFSLDDLDDSECFAEFRVHKTDIPVLLEALQLPQTFICRQGTKCDGIEGLCIALRRAAYPCNNNYVKNLRKKNVYLLACEESVIVRRNHNGTKT